MGAISKARTERRNYEAQASALEYNAEVSRQQAGSALSESAAAQLAQNRQARAVMARSRAAGVQAGIGTGGSLSDVLGQSETLAELDRLNIAYEGTMKARGFLTQADLDTFNAGRARANAKSATRQGYFSAVTSALSAYAGAGGSFGGGASGGGYGGASGGGYVGTRSVLSNSGYAGGHSIAGAYSSSVGIRPYGSLRYN